MPHTQNGLISTPFTLQYIVINIAAQPTRNQVLLVLYSRARKKVGWSAIVFIWLKYHSILTLGMLPASNQKTIYLFFYASYNFKLSVGVYSLVFHRILDLKAGWISIRPFFFTFFMQWAGCWQ